MRPTPRPSGMTPPVDCWGWRVWRGGAKNFAVLGNFPEMFDGVGGVPPLSPPPSPPRHNLRTHGRPRRSFARVVRVLFPVSPRCLSRAHETAKRRAGGRSIRVSYAHQQERNEHQTQKKHACMQASHFNPSIIIIDGGDLIWFSHTTRQSGSVCIPLRSFRGAPIHPARSLNHSLARVRLVDDIVGRRVVVLRVVVGRVVRLVVVVLGRRLVVRRHLGRLGLG